MMPSYTGDRQICVLFGGLARTPRLDPQKGGAVINSLVARRQGLDKHFFP
jgi:hypothetical protein